MNYSTMTKPVGGRGQRAPKPTMMRRIPSGIKDAIEVLAELYRSDEWDGTVENLNLISGNKQESYDSIKPDIKNELEELREWKRRAEAQLKEMSDLRESLTQLQRANIQADSNLAKAVAMKCQFEDEAKKLKAEVDRLDSENAKLSEQTADQNLNIQNLKSELALVREELRKYEAPAWNAVVARNVEIAEKEKRNRELVLKIADYRERCTRLQQEVKDRDYTISRLQEKYAVIAEGHSPEELKEIRDRTLTSLKLGKQASGYKTAKQALDKFIESLS